MINQNKKVRIRSFFIFVLIILFVFSLSCKEEDKTSGDVKLNYHNKLIYTSMEPYRFIIDNLVPQEYTVKSLLTSGSDPHTFDFTPQNIRDLSEANLYFLSQIPFEKILIDKVISLNKSLKVFDLTYGIELIYNSEGTHTTNDPAQENIELLEPDIHLWLSPKNVRKISENAYTALCNFFPEDKERFYSKFTVFKEKLDNLDSKFNKTTMLIKQKLSLPDSKKIPILVYHPFLTYFARDYGFNQVSVEIDGKVPGGKSMLRLIDTIKAEKVKFIIVQPELPLQDIQALVENTGIKVFTLKIIDYDLFQIYSNLNDCLLDGYLK